MGNAEKITILLVDDNRIFLSAMRNFLAFLSDVEVVAEVHDGQAALAQVAALRPDLVLLDIAMPEMNGLVAATAINALPHPPRIIFLSMHDNEYYRSVASDLGAVGFVSKSDFVTMLIPLIKRLVADLTAQKIATVAVPYDTH